MYCNGACCFCSVPCSKTVEIRGKTTETNDKNKETETVEDIGTYEIKKNIFGKEVVRRVQKESRAVGIEYSPQ